MSTIGHPLADLSNLLTPYTFANSAVAQQVFSDAGLVTTNSFHGSQIPGLPSQAQCIDWYSDLAGWNPTKVEVTWGESFNMYKSCIIMQGIAARYAVRQASSAQAKDYGAKKAPMGEVAWDLVMKCMKEREKAKL